MHCHLRMFRSRRAIRFAANATPACSHINFAANAAAAFSPTLQRGVNVFPHHPGREYGHSRFTRPEIQTVFRRSRVDLVCRPRAGPLRHRPKHKFATWVSSYCSEFSSALCQQTAPDSFPLTPSLNENQTKTADRNSPAGCFWIQDSPKGGLSFVTPPRRLVASFCLVGR